ncbi:MAG TPA: hypothetical protein VG477_11170, partial [Thermoanaerobaculia bacterium]|nr:hypothetical protein [Thermoanaerobaculia bacterium]
PLRVLAVFAAVLLILFGPVLFGGQVLLPLDNLRGHAPFQRFPPTQPHGNVIQGDLIQLVAPSLAAVREAWSEGRWPLWNRRAGAGMPLLADPQAQAFQPLVILGYPFPLVRAAGVTAALRVLVALVFAFLWMRRQGLGMGPSLAGALGYGLGGFVLLWVGWPIANPAALLPLVLYGISRCEVPGTRRDALLLGIGTFALLAGGHPETIAYVVGIAVLFFVPLARRAPGGLRRAGVAMGIAAMVSAPLLLPAIDYLPDTLRAHRLSSPGEGWGEGAARLLVAAPNAFGNSRYLHYWGPSNTNEDSSGFVGAATLLAALLAFGARRRFPRERLALGIAIVCFALIPWSRRLLLPLSFCLAYLGACTLERFRLGEVRRWTLPLAAIGLGAVLFWGYLAHPDPQDPSRLEVFRLGWLHWQTRFLVLATLLLAVAAFWQRWRSIVPWGLAAVIAAELLLIHGPANPPMPRDLAFPLTPPVRFLQQKLGKSPERGPGYRIAAVGRAFPPNLAALYGLTDARIYNPMAPQPYVERTAPVTTGWWGELPEFGNPAHPLYRRLGVRYLLAEPDAQLPPPLQRVFADETATIWERPGAQPRFFVDARRPAGRVITPRSEESWITLRSNLRREQALGSSHYQDGGWRLLVEGRPHPSGVEGGVFLTARLPAGPVRADILYRPAGFLWGMAIAAVGLALAAALTFRAGPTPPAEP